MASPHRLSSVQRIDADPIAVSRRRKEDSLYQNMTTENKGPLQCKIHISEYPHGLQMLAGYSSSSSSSADNTSEVERADKSPNIVCIADQEDSGSNYNEHEVCEDESNTELCSCSNAEEQNRFNCNGTKRRRANTQTYTAASISPTFQGIRIDRKIEVESNRNVVLGDSKYERMTYSRNVGAQAVNNLSPARRKNDPTIKTSEDAQNDRAHSPLKIFVHEKTSSVVSAKFRKNASLKVKGNGILKQTFRSKKAEVATQIRPFRCQICLSTFNRNLHLREHIGSVHEKKRPFKCEDCDACFGHNSSLQRHRRNVHRKGTDKTTMRTRNNSS